MSLLLTTCTMLRPNDVLALCSASARLVVRVSPDALTFYRDGVFTRFALSSYNKPPLHTADIGRILVALSDPNICPITD